jgi:hypothetical protein
MVPKTVNDGELIMASYGALMNASWIQGSMAA